MNFGKYSVATVLFLAIATVACKKVTDQAIKTEEPAVSAQSLSLWVNSGVPEIEGKWIHPGGETQPSVAEFNPGGKLVLDGGFKDFNPASWEINRAKKELRIKINWPAVWKKEHFEFYKSNGRIKGYDLEKKELIYSFSEKTDEFDLFGCVFARKW